MVRRNWLIAAIVAIAAAATAQERGRPRIDVQHYNLEVEISPNTQSLKAKAEVRLAVEQDFTRTAVFELNNALNLIRVENEKGEEVAASRNRSDFSVQISFAEPLMKGQATTLVFYYEGVLSGREESPVYGIKFAAINPERAYLLYPARWFPINGYTTDRYTAEIKVITAEQYKVIASGEESSARLADGRSAHTFKSPQPSFAGSLAVVSGEGTRNTAEGVTTTFYVRPGKEPSISANAAEIGKIMTHFTATCGLPPQASLSVVETGDGAPAGYAAPGIIFLAPSSLREEPAVRTLANQIARQWWGVLVSPESRDHIWLVNGMSRYAEMLYIEQQAGKSGFEAESKLTYIDALTVDDVPVLQAARYEDYAPEYWALTGSKGAAVLNMLRSLMGDEKFFQLLKRFPDQYAWKSVTTADFRKAAEALHGSALDYFFVQWIQSTGAPEFDLEYTVFRTQKGFRVMGKIKQDLDTFRMPVQLRIQTEGNPEEHIVEVAGTSSEFVVETFGKPVSLEMDPDRRVLRYDNSIRVAVAIRRGEQFAEIGEFAESLKEYQRALEVNRNSSLAHYRVAEIFLLQNNYQSAANEFREALNGDLDPTWTEVWSHIKLGNVFDLTGQRERALNEYQQAVRTKDNTQGAQEEAAKYIKTPFEKAGSQV